MYSKICSLQDHCCRLYLQSANKRKWQIALCDFSFPIKKTFECTMPSPFQHKILLKQLLTCFYCFITYFMKCSKGKLITFSNICVSWSIFSGISVERGQGRGNTSSVVSIVTSQLQSPWLQSWPWSALCSFSWSLFMLI